MSLFFFFICFFFFFFNDTATTEIYTLSLHDALPISSGTAEESWDAWAGLTYLPVADPLGWSSAVIIAAHPDDEILGVGGTMSMLAAAGVRLRLIVVTDGEASH